MYSKLRIVPHNETTVHLTGPCAACTKPVTVEFVNKEELQRYQDGELAQRSFTNMNLDDREFIITGVCKTCFDDMFLFDDDDETEPFPVDIYEYDDEPTDDFEVEQ